jgi:hypothetical protein
MARKFFLVAAGLLMLALSYHLGASTAVAQSAGNPVVAMAGVPSGGPLGITATAMTASGDLYGTTNGLSWTLLSNVFSAGPTPALHESWGQVKARYHATPGMTVTPGADNR